MKVQIKISPVVCAPGLYAWTVFSQSGEWLMSSTANGRERAREMAERWASRNSEERYWYDCA